MKPARPNKALARRAKVIEDRINGAAKVTPAVLKRADWLVLTYGASQRLADNIRKQEPADFYGAVADEIEARIK